MPPGMKDAREFSLNFFELVKSFLSHGEGNPQAIWVVLWGEFKGRLPVIGHVEDGLVFLLCGGKGQKDVFVTKIDLHSPTELAGQVNFKNGGMYGEKIHREDRCKTKLKL